MRTNIRLHARRPDPQGQFPPQQPAPDGARFEEGQPGPSLGPAFPIGWPTIAKRLLPAVLAGILACGCQVITYTTADGDKLSRATLGVNAQIGALTFQNNSDGSRRVELRGYNADASKTLETAVQAAVRAAVMGARP